MPIDIGPKDRTTLIRHCILFSCSSIPSLQYGKNTDERIQLRTRICLKLLDEDRYIGHQAALIGYHEEPKSGYMYSGVFNRFDIVVNTWPEFGTAHLFLDVTDSDSVRAKAVMDRVVELLADFYGAGRVQLVTEMPMFFKDPEVRNPEPEAKVGC